MYDKDSRKKLEWRPNYLLITAELNNMMEIMRYEKKLELTTTGSCQRFVEWKQQILHTSILIKYKILYFYIWNLYKL